MKKTLVAIAAGFTLICGCTKNSAPEKTLNLAIWSNYLSPETLTEFKNQTGITVQVSNYSSNEELLAKLQAGASGYDVVVPSDYMVYTMIKLGLLKELDRARIPNAKFLGAKYLKKNYDPINKFSLPYDWGTTGIAFNPDLTKVQIKSWKDLFTKPELAGKFSLLDDARETIGAALKAQGFSLNSKNEVELQKAKAYLLQARPRVKSFTSEPMTPLSTGETPVAHVYMSDALQARRQTQGRIQYILPEEGGTFWLDNLVIPSTAAHITEAHRFINFLLEGKTNAATVMNVFVAPANTSALALLPKELISDRALFPTDAMLAKCEMIEDLGETLAVWDRIWTEVKAEQ